MMIFTLHIKFEMCSFFFKEKIEKISFTIYWDHCQHRVSTKYLFINI